MAGNWGKCMIQETPLTLFVAYTIDAKNSIRYFYMDRIEKKSGMIADLLLASRGRRSLYL